MKILREFHLRGAMLHEMSKLNMSESNAIPYTPQTTAIKIDIIQDVR